LLCGPLLTLALLSKRSARACCSHPCETLLPMVFVQLRVIQYLNGLDATAAYVRMTLSVMADMRPFLLILAILVIGNR
jgi:hypothetical protein